MSGAPRIEDPSEVGRWQVLSCYTANLAAYGENWASREDVADRIARSVRLAVRTDLPDGVGFSHHGTPLHHMPDGHTLAYEGADERDQVVSGLRAEYERQGSVLVLAHSSMLPWSLARPASDGPHLVLIDDHDPRQGTWHAVDHFAGLMPSGERQESYAGRIDTGRLVHALRGEHPFTAEQERRNRLVFGFPVPLPAARCRWLVRTTTPPPGEDLPGRWLYEPNEVWHFLAGRLADQMTTTSEPTFLDDLWAASQHHRHRCAQLLAAGLADTAHRRTVLQEAESAWAQLPQTLRFATESALRGRPRTALITTTTERLAEREQTLRAEFPHYGPADSSAPAILMRSQE